MEERKEESSTRKEVRKGGREKEKWKKAEALGKEKSRKKLGRKQQERSTRKKDR